MDEEMTVRELINQLSQKDPDSLVMISFLEAEALDFTYLDFEVEERTMEGGKEIVVLDLWGIG